MSINEAKIECVVARPFIYAGKKYLENDIFYCNINNVIQRRFLKTGRIYQVEEDRYDYILCTTAPKLILGTTYKYGDVIDVSSLDIRKRELFIRRGWFKKIIKDLKKPKQEIKEAVKEDVVEDKITLSTISKEINIRASELKYICNSDLDMGIKSYTQKITEEQKKQILTHFGQ